MKKPCGCENKCVCNCEFLLGKLLWTGSLERCLSCLEHKVDSLCRDPFRLSLFHEVLTRPWRGEWEGWDRENE